MSQASRCRHCIGAAALATMLASCALPYKDPVIYAATGKPEFPGIAQAMAASGHAEVLMVHGMCTHTAEWARGGILALAAQLGAGSPEIRREPVPGTQVEIFRASLESSRGSVTAVALLWSPVTATLKGALCYDQTVKSAMCRELQPPSPPYPYERATVNQGLKDELLDDCLADALIYQGRSRDAISDQVQAGIVAAFGPSARSDHPLIVVTDSLGSKITFDALFRLLSSPGSRRDVAATAIDRMAIVFMRANQLPILSLADRSLPVTRDVAPARYPADPLGAVLSHRRAPPGAATSSLVVAFTDPNDLLSYVLGPAEFGHDSGYDVVDVVVSNQPTYFGALERPDFAHTTYATNPAVMRLIACGHPRVEKCRD